MAQEAEVFVQWKGTNVCCDVRCECGAHIHHDGDFAYRLRCPRCSSVYEMPSVMPLKKIGVVKGWDEHPEGPFDDIKGRHGLNAFPDDGAVINLVDDEEL